ncbi:type IV toxin-antitoxin system AbiEi family antitoxin domain-containing protein [Leifsonia sp. A12D58]|uniref:type IV toxin-antitoxin system AbiEi family antitoxin domain-containing protein n=1 Tax=Leifsonia sp. A12D58 TaxID=3397674 RepID=UPI0039E1DA54
MPHSGLIPAASLKRLGVSQHTVEALVGQRELVRLRHGVYVSGEHWNAAKANERYRLFVRATHFLGKRPVVVSHESAAVLHGLPTIGAWPTTVHVIDSDATGGSNARFTTRHRAVSTTDVVQVGGIAVTSLARTLVDVAMHATFLVAVTMIDHALRTEQERELAARQRGIRSPAALTKTDLYAALRPDLSRALRSKAERAIGFATDLSANPGETLGRVRMHELGFEVPELQVCFPDVGGHDYWVDYYWRSIRKIGEFDGTHKYTRGAVLGDRDPAEVLVAEKVREDALRQDPGCDSFDRWDWDTAISPRRFYAFLVKHGMPSAR